MNSPDISGYSPMRGSVQINNTTEMGVVSGAPPSASGAFDSSVVDLRKENADGGRAGTNNNSSVRIVNVNCPKCRHCFVLGGCGGQSGGGCKYGLALSGGGLVWPRSPPPASDIDLSIYFAFISPPEQDLSRLRKTDAYLRQSGWYYEYLSWQASQRALKRTAPGTFLLRDSSDNKFLYSLSVQTSKGPTSVRIHYDSGMFRLDAEPTLTPMMPQFDCVLKLVEYYVKVTCMKDKENKKGSGLWAGARGHVWVDAEGGPHSPVEVRKPLLSEPPKLAHCARTAVWRALSNAPSPTMPLRSPVRQLGLPQPLQVYLEEYPYIC